MLPANVPTKKAAVVILPVALTCPLVNTLPAVALPVALTNPAVNILPAVALPVELIRPAVNKLPPVILAALVIVEVALINPAVKILAPTRLPVVLISPLEVIEVRVPTEVIFGCAFVVTVPAVTALVTLPLTLAP